MRRKGGSCASSTGIGIVDPAHAIAGLGADGTIPDRRSDDRGYPRGDPRTRADIDSGGAALPQPHQGVQRHVRESARWRARGRTDDAHQECASAQRVDDVESATGQARDAGVRSAQSTKHDRSRGCRSGDARCSRRGRAAGRLLRSHGPARWPAPWRGALHQGSVRHFRHAHDVGHGCSVCERSPAARRNLRQAPERRGCDPDCQGEPGRDGNAELAQLVWRAVLQPVRYGTESRHLQRRLRRIGGRKPGDVLHRRGNRRLHPSPRQEQQPGRPRADAGTGQPRRHDRRGTEHAGGTAVPHGEGCRPRARGDRRLRSKGRADRVQHRPAAVRALSQLHERAIAERTSNRRDPRAHGQSGVQRSRWRRHRPHRARHRRSAPAGRHDRRPGTGRRAAAGLRR